MLASDPEDDEDDQDDDNHDRVVEDNHLSIIA